jgi:hypothetical protein
VNTLRTEWELDGNTSGTSKSKPLPTSSQREIFFGPFGCLLPRLIGCQHFMLLTMFITHFCYTSQYHPTKGSIYITTQCNSSSQNERTVGSTLVNQFKQFRNRSISIIYFQQIQHNFRCVKLKCFWKVNYIYIYICARVYIPMVSTKFFEVDLSYRVCNLTIHLWLSTVNHANY